MRQVLKVDNDKLLDASKFTKVVKTLGVVSYAELSGGSDRRHAESSGLQTCVALKLASSAP